MGAMEQVAFDLKAWRTAQGLNKTRLAEIFGMSRWTVARMEDAGTVPKTVVLACKALEGKQHDR